jgi:hypothetical protein
MLWKRRFQIVAILLGLWLTLELVCRLGAEIFWFQEVNYLSVYLVRLTAKGVLGVVVFSLSVSYLLVNLWFAQRLKHSQPKTEALLKPKSSNWKNREAIAKRQQYYQEKRRDVSKTLKLSWLLPLAVSLCLVVGLILFYYSHICFDYWSPNSETAHITSVIPAQFRPETIWQIGNNFSDRDWYLAPILVLTLAILIYPRILLTAIALVISLLSGFILSEHWDKVLQFFQPTSFDASEAVFKQDISFYIFTLPFLELLELWLTGLALSGFVSVLLVYLLSGNSLSEGRFLGFSRQQQSHLYGLGGCLMLAIAFNFWLSRYELLYSTRGVTYGASYTDVTVQLPANTLLSILALAIAVILFGESKRQKAEGRGQKAEGRGAGEQGSRGAGEQGGREAKGRRQKAEGRRQKAEGKTNNELVGKSFRHKLLFYGLGLYLVIALGIGIALPYAVQYLVVQPNELGRERPYIERAIALTRQAFALNNIDAQSFDPQNHLTEADLQANALTIRNIRLWDKRPLLETNRQLQQIRLYYRFPDADIDRYTLAREEQKNKKNEQRQILIAARELDYSAVPEKAQTWVNRHLIYTHGYGFTLSPVNTVAPGGLPEYFVRDIGIDKAGALTVANEAVRSSVPIGNPRIYYGEITNNYVMTGTSVRELDYPSGSENAYNTYDGGGGVKIGSWWRKLLFAKYLNDWRMVFTPEFLPDTKVLFRRNITQRIQAIAPFLRFDRDPYLVAADPQDPTNQPQSCLYWLVDAYTTSDRYPYSDPASTGINYIRNSVKVVIDAYHGSVNFYVADPSDPIIKTWWAIFPSLFKPLDTMPASLRSHIRYPIDFFKIQSEQLMTYHMTDPQVFYNREDQWQIPNEVYGDKPQLVEPYYLITSLPIVPFEEFILLLPYTPSQRTNLIAWLAARSDGENYGRLLLYIFPKQRLVFGPEQIEARINQDPVISQQISLWNRQGSRTIQGNLLVIPIEQSLLYVEPLYLEADQNSLPTLVRVIVAYENRIVMAQTLEQALQAIFQKQKTPEPIIRPVEEPGALR